MLSAFLNAAYPVGGHFKDSPTVFKEYNFMNNANKVYDAFLQKLDFKMNLFFHLFVAELFSLVLNTCCTKYMLQQNLKL